MRFLYVVEWAERRILGGMSRKWIQDERTLVLGHKTQFLFLSVGTVPSQGPWSANELRKLTRRTLFSSTLLQYAPVEGKENISSTFLLDYWFCVIFQCVLQRHPNCTSLRQWKGGPVKIGPLALVQVRGRWRAAESFSRLNAMLSWFINVSGLLIMKSVTPLHRQFQLQNSGKRLSIYKSHRKQYIPWGTQVIRKHEQLFFLRPLLKEKIIENNRFRFFLSVFIKTEKGITSIIRSEPQHPFCTIVLVV